MITVRVGDAHWRALRHYWLLLAALPVWAVRTPRVENGPAEPVLPTCKCGFDPCRPERHAGWSP